MDPLFDNVYVAEKIIQRKKFQGTYKYLIKWKGYGKKDCTWEPERNILDPLLIDEFLAKVMDKESIYKDMRTRLRRPHKNYVKKMESHVTDQHNGNPKAHSYRHNQLLPQVSSNPKQNNSSNHKIDLFPSSENKKLSFPNEGLLTHSNIRSKINDIKADDATTEDMPKRILSIHESFSQTKNESNSIADHPKNLNDSNHPPPIEKIILSIKRRKTKLGQTETFCTARTSEKIKKPPTSQGLNNSKIDLVVSKDVQSNENGKICDNFEKSDIVDIRNNKNNIENLSVYKILNKNDQEVYKDNNDHETQFNLEETTENGMIEKRDFYGRIHASDDKLDSSKSNLKIDNYDTTSTVASSTNKVVIHLIASDSSSDKINGDGSLKHIQILENSSQCDDTHPELGESITAKLDSENTTGKSNNFDQNIDKEKAEVTGVEKTSSVEMLGIDLKLGKIIKPQSNFSQDIHLLTSYALPLSPPPSECSHYGSLDNLAIEEHDIHENGQKPLNINSERQKTGEVDGHGKAYDIETILKPLNMNQLPSTSQTNSTSPLNKQAQQFSCLYHPLKPTCLNQSCHNELCYQCPLLMFKSHRKNGAVSGESLSRTSSVITCPAQMRRGPNKSRLHSDTMSHVNPYFIKHIQCLAYKS